MTERDREVKNSENSRIGTSHCDDQEEQLRMVRHVKCKNDNDWVKHCMTSVD